MDTASVYEADKDSSKHDINMLLAQYRGSDAFKDVFMQQFEKLNTQNVEKKEIPIEHRIVLTDEAPNICAKQYRTNLKDKKKIEAQITEML